MEKYTKQVLGELKRDKPSLRQSRRPRWLERAPWKPDLCLSTQGDRRILAVDILPSGTIPRTIYTEVVSGLLNEHRALRVVICVLDAGLEEHPDIEQFCRDMHLGLKVLSGLGLTTVVKTDLDPRDTVIPLPREDGWFPQSILDRVSGLSNLVFAGVLDRFVNKIRGAGNDDATAFRLVCSTIDNLLQAHPTFRPNIGQFMQLQHFENLFKMTLPNANEHVFHSFRVFLAGCSVVNQFYNCFKQAQLRFSGGNEGDLSVEYSWLLASIFHDIGHPKEKASVLIREELEDEDLDVTVADKETRWVRPEYQTACRTLASLSAYIMDPGNGGKWDGGAIQDKEAEKISVDWRSLYKDLNHAIVGAIDFLAQTFKVAAAANERRNRPFVISHAVPAALAILLHDWQVWEQAKSWGLFPIDASIIPLAALLIYVDTWDDYKRSGEQSNIYVPEYCVDSQGAHVLVEWGDSAALEKEQKKYNAFKKALRNPPFQMKITPRMGRTS